MAIYYFIQFLVLCYVIGYTIIANRGYQAEDDVNGSTSVKLKGSGSIGNGITLQPLDSMDLVVPSNEMAPLCTHNDTSNCTEIEFSPMS